MSREEECAEYVYKSDDKNALVAKNVQTTRSKFVLGSRVEEILRWGDGRAGEESLRKEKDSPSRLYSALPRRDKWKTVEQENGGRVRANGKKNGTTRAHTIGAFSRRGRIGFNIKRFYEPNKKAINRSRLDRRA